MGKAGELKPATSIKVRHILCEKLSKAEQALAELKSGIGFPTVLFENFIFAVFIIWAGCTKV